MDYDPALSSDSLGSLKAHFLDEKGLFKKFKVNQILISNQSKYDLIIVTEMDPLITKLIDGTKVTKDHQVPSIETILSGQVTKIEVRTKINYLTVLRKDPTMSGYFLIRSKRYIKRSAKWTATSKMVDACQMHCTDAFLNQFVDNHITINSPIINPAHQSPHKTAHKDPSSPQKTLIHTTSASNLDENDRKSLESGSDSEDDEPTYPPKGTSKKGSVKLQNEILSISGSSSTDRGEKKSCWCCCF